MILQLDGADGADIEAARSQLAALATSWGHDLTDDPAPAAGGGREERVIDPISLTALIVSIPSAALAVYDLADRIRTRRRAQQLIDQARDLAAHRVSVYLMAQQTPVEIGTLDPDRLLDLLADGDPTT